jgi:hypothetical protein
MFDFLKKRTSINDPQLTMAGIWAGVIFRQGNARFGNLPDFMAPENLKNIIDQVVKKMDLRPDAQGLSGINMIASTIAFDDSGLAEKIVQRFDAGDRTISDDEIREALQLSMKNAASFADSLTRRRR